MTEAAGPPAATSPRRKGLHVLLSLGAAGVVAWLPPLEGAVILAGATTLALAVEVGRRSWAALGRRFRRLGPLLKPGEEGRITGATTLSVGFTLAALVFPGLPALAGILFAGLADPAASLAGRRAGRRLPGGKSLVGSAAAAAVGLAIGLALGLGPGAALFTALLVAAVEAFTLPVDDNLYLPLAGAGAVTLVLGLGL